jgi:demethylmenaquinone methyltransferase/2-methoxy-6-polyprenyl-1,4-benzoquinol methylase
MARVLRPGGRLAILEVCEPEGRLASVGFSLWFNRVVPLIGGVVSDADAYRYLPKSVAYLPGPSELRQTLCEVGFSGVNRHLLSGGLSQLYTATREGSAT